MPKINVYLPDALADRVRDARLPVSRICQVALTRALDGADSAAHEEPADLTLPEPIDLTPPPNHHVAAILRQSYDSAAARGSAAVETIDILQAFLDEGESLVLNTVELLGFTVASIQAAIDAAAPAPPAAAGAPGPVMTGDARAAIAVAAAQAAAHGSGVTTGSHLLLGLLGDTGTAGRALKAAGVTEVVTPAVLSALYHGVSFGRVNLGQEADAASLRVMLLNVLDRLDRLERQIAPSP
ncbi:Clp protease N-terminal domain-containing protein [Phytohabitans suffuscus]